MSACQQCRLGRAAVVAAIAVALAGIGPVGAATIHVSTAGDDTNSGLEWAAAKRTVQVGLDTASAGDQVWVAAGTYVECITLRAGVALYGGFAGGETDLSQRDWAARATILDGNQDRSVVTAPPGADAATRIDGFTIRNGNPGSISLDGGGIRCLGSSPTIANNVVTGNTAGGGIYCEGGAAAILNNTITGNTGSYGSGIYCLGGSGTILNNTIAGNTTSLGGGIYLSSASPLIAGNTIADNSGDGISCSKSSPVITGNRILHNSGDGIYCPPLSSPTVANNTICGSSTGIYCYSTAPAIVNNTICGNGAGVFCCGTASPAIVNTILAYNYGGLNVTGGTPSLRNTCAYGNLLYNYQGMTDPTGTDGNISVDPRIAHPFYVNVHIQPDSPCIDAGDDSVVQESWQDVDGQPRLRGSHVDMGADESDGTAWPSGGPEVIHVSPLGDDTRDGLSWAQAKRTVQAAIDAAEPSGGQVWVAAGTYVENIVLGREVAVYGGFAGDETDLSQRDWAAHRAVLDGNHANCVVLAVLGWEETARIDGFTIRNGNGTLWESMIMGGGGVHCRSGRVTIANNQIVGNTGRRGAGGIYCDSGSPTILNNRIAGNKVDIAYSNGGGIACYNASATIVGNVIEGNSAAIDGGEGGPQPFPGGGASGGGGIYCSGGSAVIAGNVIAGNGAENGGGIRCAGCPATITNNTITGNDAAAGGGIYVDGTSPVTISNTIIALNSSGIRSAGSTAPTLRCNCVYGNAVYDYYGVNDPKGANGNISTDPQLASAAHGNVHIQPGSPCLDAGDDAAVQAGWTDMDGQPRVAGAHVDIGADESDGATAWPAGPAVIVRVRPDGDDANDGASWATARRTVQAGIDAASAACGEVWVAGGTYAERIDLRGLSHVYGGFAGNETQRSARDSAAHPTVLDGGRGGSVVTARSGYHVSTIDGFVIRNGSGTPLWDSSVATYNGGGMYCSYASPIVTGNVFTGNGADKGGGIYSACGWPVITGNAVIGNEAGEGGGFYGVRSAAVFAGNRVAGNTASASGGGMSVGGMLLAGLPIFGQPGVRSSCDIIGNTISGNAAAASGGGIYARGVRTIAGNAIAGNAAGTRGGGIYCGAASHTVLPGNTIAGNRAADGGGIYSDTSLMVPAAAPGTYPPGGLSWYGTTVSSSIIAFNSSGVYGPSGVWRCNCVFGNAAYDYSYVADPTGTDGNISQDPRFVSAGPGDDGQWGTADDAFGDLRLLPGSPCIDAGSNADVPADSLDLDGDGDAAEPLPFDLAGLARLADDPATADTGSGTAPIVDMGAREYRCGDVDGDGHVDVIDLLLLIDGFGASPGDAAYNPACDFDSNAAVDVLDLLYLIGYFGA